MRSSEFRSDDRLQVAAFNFGSRTPEKRAAQVPGQRLCSEARFSRSSWS